MTDTKTVISKTDTGLLSVETKVNFVGICMELLRSIHPKEPSDEMIPKIATTVAEWGPRIDLFYLTSRLLANIAYLSEQQQKVIRKKLAMFMIEVQETPDVDVLCTLIVECFPGIEKAPLFTPFTVEFKTYIKKYGNTINKVLATIFALVVHLSGSDD